MPANVFTNSASAISAAGASAVARAVDRNYLLRRTGAFVEPKQPSGDVWTNQTVTTTLASGSSFQVAVGLFEGETVTSITFVSGTTAWSGATGPIRFFVLRNSSGTVLAKSADDGANAWGASAEKTLNMVTPYLVPAGGTGLYYLEVVHSFGSGASNSFCGHAEQTIAAQRALATPLLTGLQTSALSAGIPTDPLAVVDGSFRAKCYFA